MTPAANTTPKSSKGFVILLCLFVVLLAAAVASFYLKYDREEKEFNDRVKKTLNIEQVKITPDNILGNYSVKMESVEDVQYLAGYIDLDILGSYTLHILSEYDPRTYLLDIDEEGRVFNNELGLGLMTYKANINKTIIRFEKDGLVCTLTK